MNGSGILWIRKYRWSLVWTILILILSLLPKRSLPEMHVSIPYLDKVVHFTLYFILMTFYAMESKEKSFNALIFKGLIGSLILSCCTELAQKYVIPGRTFEWLDVVANVSGSVLGILFFRLKLNRLNELDRNRE